MIDLQPITATEPGSRSMLEFYRERGRLILPTDDLVKAEELFFERAPSLVKVFSERKDFKGSLFGRCIVGANSPGDPPNILDNNIVVSDRAGIQIDDTVYKTDQERQLLRPVIIYHESRELWYRIMPGTVQKYIQSSPGDFTDRLETAELAHLLALAEQYFKAEMDGVADTHLNFQLRCIREIGPTIGLHDWHIARADTRCKLAFRTARDFRVQGKDRMDKDTLRKWLWEEQEQTKRL